MKKINYLAGALALLISNSVLAHGYPLDPKSRSWLCKDGNNSDCGLIIYEPQSLEAPSGFPNGGPPDGKIASANLPRFKELDEQSANRWFKTAIRPGKQTFHWGFTTPHRTREWRYYITKQDWNPNAPLSRASFELTPFCKKDAVMTVPDRGGISHECTVPARTGYQVILGVWEIGDTTNSFYNVMDVTFQ